MKIVETTTDGKTIDKIFELIITYQNKGYEVVENMTATAICRCRTPREAIWVAQRLNLAATLEQMTYDFATGKTDGQEIVNLVLNSIKS
jgi:hypothetical protein